MKKILSTMLAVLMVLTIMPITAHAATFSGACGDNLTWTYDDTSKELIVEGTGEMYDFESSWNAYKNDVEAVTIKDGVTTIGAYAFEEFSKLTYLAIPDTVTWLVEGCFMDCTNLAYVNIPSGVKVIGNSAFYGCSKLSNVNICEGVEKIEVAAFGATKLSGLRIPNSVKEITGNPCFECEKLADYIVNDDHPYFSVEDGVLFNKDKTEFISCPLTKIGTSYTVPSTVEKIADGAFYYCTNLRKVVLPNDIKEIGRWAFNDCYALNLIDLPSGLQIIGDEAFSYTNLKRLVLPNTVTEIGVYSFYGANIESLTISNSLTTIPSGAFADNKVTGLIIPNGVTTINDHAFGNCTSLTSVTIPKSVTTIGQNIFSACPINSVSYLGTQSDWENVSVGLYNESLTSKLTFHETHNYTSNVITPATCKATGLKEYTCSVCGFSYTDTIAKTSHNYGAPATTKKATTSANGTLNYTCVDCGATKTSSIASIKTVTLSATKYTYDGKVKKPTVKVVDANGKTVAATNYTVTYASGRKNVGKYTVKIAFKGNYSGTVSKTFTIVPKTTSISSLTAVSKGFTVKWKKQATQTTGYQIQIATDSKFTKGVKNYTVTKNSTVSKKITKLTGSKKYYVRIRTYKTVSGTKYYASWSAKNYVTTKK